MGNYLVRRKDDLKGFWKGFEKVICLGSVMGTHLVRSTGPCLVIWMGLCLDGMMDCLLGF